MRTLTLLAVGSLVVGCSMSPTTFTPLEPDAAQDGCGDGEVGQGEACDGDNLDGEDCTSVGSYSGGALACQEGCLAFDTSECTAAPTVPRLRLPMNDAYFGRVAVADTLRPRFVWEPSDHAGAETISYELQYGTDPTFESGAVTVPTTLTSYQPEEGLLVSHTHPVGLRYYWRVRACASGECSAQSSTWWINLGRSPNDFNGDGFADLAVGAPRADGPAGADAGRVFIYFGGAGSLDLTADGVLDGVAAGDEFGGDVASAGDVNRDGFIDIIVGAQRSDANGADSGRAYVYLGGPGTTFETTPDGVLEGLSAGDRLGESVETAGDVNADGFADVVVGAFGQGGSLLGSAYVYFGGAGGVFDVVPDGVLHNEGEYIGGEVASAGDTNGDGFADVIVTGFCDPDLCAHVYVGAAGSSFDNAVDATLVSDATGTNDGFGSSVASAGDVNGDGWGDVVIGAPSSLAGGLVERGRAYVYFGGPSSFDATADGVLTGTDGSRFGEAVDTAGDVNGDGFADLIVGAPYSSVAGPSTGNAYVYFGQPGASFDSVPEGTLTGATGNEFGASVASIGDEDGDGYDDILVGAYQNSVNGSQAGAAFLYLGAAGSVFESSADRTLLGAEPGGVFGSSVTRLLTSRIVARATAWEAAR